MTDEGQQQPAWRRELPRVLRVEVREVMHVPARDEEDVAWSDTHWLAIEDPGRDAVHPGDRLIEGFVAVQHRHVGNRGLRFLRPHHVAASAAAAS